MDYCMQYGGKDFTKIKNISKFVISKFKVKKIHVINSSDESKMIFHDSELPIENIFILLQNKTLSCLSITFSDSEELLQIFKPLFFNSPCNLWHACLYFTNSNLLDISEEINKRFVPEFIFLSNDTINSIDIQDYDCMNNVEILKSNKNVLSAFYNPTGADM